jgi:hypothetical protein
VRAVATPSFQILATMKFEELFSEPTAYTEERTVNDEELVIVWPLTVTVTAPVVAPAGTVVVRLVAEDWVTVAAIPLKLTMLLEAVELKFTPSMVTVEPTVPLVGVKLVILGAGVAVSLWQPQIKAHDRKIHARPLLKIFMIFIKF